MMAGLTSSWTARRRRRLYQETRRLYLWAISKVFCVIERPGQTTENLHGGEPAAIEQIR